MCRVDIPSREPFRSTPEVTRIMQRRVLQYSRGLFKNSVRVVIDTRFRTGDGVNSRISLRVQVHSAG